MRGLYKYSLLGGALLFVMSPIIISQLWNKEFENNCDSPNKIQVYDIDLYNELLNYGNSEQYSNPKFSWKKTDYTTKTHSSNDKYGVVELTTIYMKDAVIIVKLTNYKLIDFSPFDGLGVNVARDCFTENRSQYPDVLWPL